MTSDRNTLIFKWFLLLLSVVFILFEAQPIKGINKGNTLVVKLNDNVGISELLLKYPELNDYLNERDTQKVFKRNEPLKARAKKLERQKRFGLMSSNQRKNIEARLTDIHADINRIETHKANAIKAGTFPNLNTTFKLNINDTHKNIKLLSLLNSIPEVKFAQPVLYVTTQALPNDTYIDPEQNNDWTKGTLSSDISDMWGLESIGMKSVWDTTESLMGNGIVIAVIDSGIDPFHEDISNALWRNDDNEYGFDFVNNDAYPIDGHGHGTHVAGTIAAEINNHLGISGVAPGVKIMSLKALSNSGSGSDINIAAAIEFAADNGADIINMSLGGYGYSSVMEEAVNYAHSLGVIIVAAAGNSAENADKYSPAMFDNVITVGSLSTNETLSSYSNYGSTIEVVAPGEHIISLRASGTSLGTALDSHYTTAAGTSMAAPHVSGVLALIKQKYPGLSNNQIAQVLYQSSTDIGETGKDDVYGYGKINAYTAISNTSLLFGSISEPYSNTLLNSSLITIKGNAFAENFSHYTLSYKKDTETTWTTLVTSSTEVTNGILGTWDTRTLKTGTYQLKLSIHSTTKSFDFISGPYQQDSRIKAGYPKLITQHDIKSHPVLFSSDLATELIAIASQNMYSLNLNNAHSTSTYTPVLNSSAYFSFPQNRAPTVGDIDQDGSNEILIGGQGILTILESDTSKTEHDLTSLLGGNFLINKVMLADIDQDTKLDIVISVSGRGLYIFKEKSGTLSLLNSSWPIMGSFEDPLIADVNADGSNEIIALTTGGVIQIFDKDGHVLLSQSIGVNISKETFQKELFIGDIDQDGDIEIGAVKLNISDDKITLYLFHHDGSLVSGWPFTYEGYYFETSDAPVMADITGDTVPEVIVAQYGWNGTHLFILDSSGKFLHNTAKPHVLLGQYAQHSSIMIADVNNDSVNDIVLASTGETSKISFLNHEGNTVIDDISIHNVSHPYTTNIGLTICDYDNNNKLDILSIASSSYAKETVITVHELETPLNPSLLQRLTYRGNEQLSGLTRKPLSDTEPISSLKSHIPSSESLEFSWILPGYTPEGINVTITKKSEPEIAVHSDFYESYNVMINELNLDSSETYLVKLQAKSGDEYSLIRTYSVQIDTTAPILDKISVAHPSQHVIKLTIDATDNETGIKGFTYALGSKPNLADIKHWTTIDSTTTTLDVSTFVATTRDSDNPTLIYVQAKAINNANTASTENKSTPIDFTYLVPESPNLNTTSSFASDTHLQFIDWEAQKSLFDLSRIYYGVGTTSGSPDITGWKSASSEDTRIALLNLNLHHNSSYVIYTQVENVYGYSSEISTKNILIDTTPPTTPLIHLDTDSNSGISTTFSATSTDNESDIKQYWIAIGSEIHLNDIIEWQSQSSSTEFDISHVYQTKLQHLPYFYIKLKSENNAGLLSDSITHKMSTDIETPRITNIQINGKTVDEGIEYQGGINLSFSATDNIAIKDVQIRLFDSSKSLISTITPQASYASVFLARFTESITAGPGYSIQIQITDTAGNAVYYTSPKFKYINLDIDDTSPPLIHNIKVNNKDLLSNDILTNSLNFNLNIEDNISISTVTLILKNAQHDIVSAIVAEKQGSSYVATFDKSLFSDNHKYEIEIIATDISSNEISSKLSFTFADIETFEVTNVLPYPNPFNPDLETCKIRFNLEGQSVVKLYIHSITGRRLYTYSAIHETGAQILEWDGRDDFGNGVSIGVYFAYLIVENTESSDSVKKVLKLAVLK